MNNLLKVYEGRIGRKVFFLGWCFFAILLLTVSIATAWLFKELTNVLVFVPSAFICTAVVFYSWSLHVRRWHDLDKSGWMSLLTFVPIVNLIVTLILLFKKGQEVSNSYGDPVSEKEGVIDSLTGANENNDVGRVMKVIFIVSLFIYLILSIIGALVLFKNALSFLSPVFSPVTEETEEVKTEDENNHFEGAGLSFDYPKFLSVKTDEQGFTTIDNKKFEIAKINNQSFAVKECTSCEVGEGRVEAVWDAGLSATETEVYNDFGLELKAYRGPKERAFMEAIEDGVTGSTSSTDKMTDAEVISQFNKMREQGVYFKAVNLEGIDTYTIDLSAIDLLPSSFEGSRVYFVSLGDKIVIIEDSSVIKSELQKFGIYDKFYSLPGVISESQRSEAIKTIFSSIKLLDANSDNSQPIVVSNVPQLDTNNTNVQPSGSSLRIVYPAGETVWDRTYPNEGTISWDGKNLNSSVRISLRDEATGNLITFDTLWKNSGSINFPLHTLKKGIYHVELYSAPLLVKSPYKVVITD